MIFIIQNPHAVNISFLGAHLRRPLAVALFLSAIAGRAADGRRGNRPDHPASADHATRPAHATGHLTPAQDRTRLGSFSD
jgi:hypothetical protein